MKYAVKFTETAKSDLRDIAIYIAEQSKDKEFTKNFVRELADRCGRLADFPLMGSIPKSRMLISSEYRFLVHKEYLIFYSVDEEKACVYVQAVFNAKKDYMRVLQQMI